MGFSFVSVPRRQAACAGGRRGPSPTCASSLTWRNGKTNTCIHISYGVYIYIYIPGIYAAAHVSHLRKQLGVVEQNKAEAPLRPGEKSRKVKAAVPHWRIPDLGQAIPHQALHTAGNQHSLPALLDQTTCPIRHPLSLDGIPNGAYVYGQSGWSRVFFFWSRVSFVSCLYRSCFGLFTYLVFIFFALFFFASQPTSTRDLCRLG